MEGQRLPRCLYKDDTQICEAFHLKNIHFLLNFVEQERTRAGLGLGGKAVPGKWQGQGTEWKLFKAWEGRTRLAHSPEADTSHGCLKGVSNGQAHHYL